MNHQPTCSEEVLLAGTGYEDLDDCSDSSQACSQADSDFSSPVSESGSDSITTESSSCDTEEYVEDVEVFRIPRYSMTAVRGRQRARAALGAGTVVDEEAKIVWLHGSA